MSRRQRTGPRVGAHDTGLPARTHKREAGPREDSGDQDVLNLAVLEVAGLRHDDRGQVLNACADPGLVAVDGQGLHGHAPVAVTHQSDNARACRPVLQHTRVVEHPRRRG